MKVGMIFKKPCVRRVKPTQEVNWNRKVPTGMLRWYERGEVTFLLFDSSEFKIERILLTSEINGGKG